MMKRFIVLVAAVAALTTVASGAVLQFQVLPPAPGSTIGTTSQSGISSDGKYVGGFGWNSAVSTVYSYPVYWTLNPNTGAAPVRTDVNGGWGSGTFTGIDQKAGGTVWTSVNAGGTNSAGWTGRYGTPVVTNGLKDQLGANSQAKTGSFNAVAAMASGTDAWIVGSWTKGPNGLVWIMSSGQTAVFAPTGAGGSMGLSAVATNGNAIGSDNGGVGYSGFSPRPRAVYWTAAIGNGAAVGIPTFASNGTTTQTQGFGVSDDGQYFTGLGYEAGNVNYVGFRWKMGDANATKLFRPAGSIGTPTICNGYDVASDGTVAGSSYMDDSALTGGLAGNHDTGTIWYPGQTVGTRVIDALIAAGVYDPNIRSIGRVYGITALGGGKFAISAESSYWLSSDHTGTNYGSRAIYAVIPEPATLSFLALGGLALLRRRR